MFAMFPDSRISPNDQLGGRPGRVPDTTIVIMSLLSVLTPTTVFSQTDKNEGITQTPWEINRGEGVIKSATPVDTDRAAALAQGKVPPADAEGWKTPPIDDQGNISIDEASTLNTCGHELDFTYFQTLVTIPTGTTLSNFEVTFSRVDDLARIHVYNGKGDKSHESIPLRGTNVSSSDLSQFVAVGETNRIVIVQADSCKSKNTIKNIQIKTDGTVVAMCNPAAVSPHGDFVRGSGDGQCPQGTRLATFGEAKQAGNKSCGVLEAWDIARLACGGSTDGTGYGCDSRESDNRALGHSLCVKVSD